MQESTKKNTLAIVLILITLIIGLSIFGFWYYTNTPRYAVSEMSKHAKQGDYEKFSKYVNEEQLFENAEVKYRKQIKETLEKDEEFQNNPFKDLAGGAIENKVNESMLEAKNSFRKDIENKESFRKEPNFESIKQNGDSFTIETLSSDSETKLMKFKKIDGVFQYFDYE